MAHFLQDRSCNDDFVPLIRITRSTCEPNRLEQASYVPTENTNYNPYPDANIYFKERKNILSWEADPRLEAIDARLEEICARLEKKWNDDEILDTDDTHDTTRNDTTTRHDEGEQRELELIMEYANEKQITFADAVNYLNCCHYCGNTKIQFGWEYCNEWCESYAIDFCYPCFRGKNCKVCTNWFITNYHNDEDYEVNGFTADFDTN